uniref:TTF-type domain-containing protein n=1 Tax=Amphilophus citrinellus TaxID=61819 RepID=A0A3Q0T7S3_AMPCI
MSCRSGSSASISPCPQHPLLSHQPSVCVFLHCIHEPPLWSSSFSSCLSAPFSTSFVQYIPCPSSAHVQTISALTVFVSKPPQPDLPISNFVHPEGVADEGEEHRGPDDEEGEEQRDAAESAGARPYSEDPAEWPSPHETGNSFRQYMVESGSQKCSEGPYPRSDKNKRCFSKTYCFRLLSNGEKVERDWLLYSKSTNRVYCFACKLFGEAKVADTRLVVGFNNWQCLSKSLTHHETSGSHINAHLMWKELASRLRLDKTTDDELQRALAAEKAHWRSAVSKKVSGSLSWCTQNEFLDSISECVLGKITAQIKASKYFAVELNRTLSVSKHEQTSVIIWYIHTAEKKKVTIAESFVGFTAVKDATGKGLTDTLTGVLDGLGLDLANCRGQSYDNGSNMRGINKGVQALIQQRCPEALFIPCCSHSLNLLLCDAAASNKECLTFFGTIQRLYTICSSSLKSDTWEAKLDSVKAVLLQLGGILDALEQLEEAAGDSKIVSEAKSLSDEIVSMEFLVCLLVWYDLLEINFASKALQAADVSLDTAIRLIDSLKEFLLRYREEGFQKSLEIAGRIAIEMGASPKFKERRFRKQKKALQVLVFNVLVDIVRQELSERFSNLQPVSEKFKFITKMEHMTKAELEESVTAYTLTASDVSRDIIQEIYPASRLLKGYKALEKLNFLIQENLDLVFPDLTVALRVFLTMPLTVASAERSYSKLKLIKTYLRSNMSNDRFTQLAVISIENRVARSISYDATLEKWASAKAQNVTI